jgi:hypothetical protein
MYEQEQLDDKCNTIEYDDEYERERDLFYEQDGW